MAFPYEHPKVRQKLEELKAAIAEVEREQLENYPQIEIVAHRTGQAVAQALQEQWTQEAAKLTPQVVHCPTCGKECRTKIKARKLTTVDGPAKISEPLAHCPACRRDFFPSA